MYIMKAALITMIFLMGSVAFFGTVQAQTCGEVILSDTALSSDIICSGTDAGLIIGKDGIVLDCAGYNITGDGNYGIIVSNKSGVEIKNCNIQGWKRAGIKLWKAKDADISLNEIKSGGNGIEMLNSKRNAIRFNRIERSGKNGVYIAASSEGNEISDNEISYSREYGIVVYDGRNNYGSGNQILVDPSIITSKTIYQSDVNYIGISDSLCKTDIFTYGCCDIGICSTCEIDDPYMQDACSYNSECKVHYACVGNTCQLVDGEGPDTCSSDADCDGMHYGCGAGGSCQLLPGEGPDECTSDLDCSGNVGGGVCPADTDIVVNLNLDVCGKNCGCGPGAEQDSSVVSVLSGGIYNVTSNITYSGNCQLNESAYLSVNGVDGPIAWDDPYNSSLPPDSIDLEKLVFLGQFNFNAGDNEVNLTSAVECPPETDANSVHLRNLCLKKITHYECVNNTCTEVDGPGPNTCATDSDCDGVHYGCDWLNGRCTELPGEGTDTCSSDSQCQKHFECIGNTCQLVDGPGPDECAIDSDCGTHWGCDWATGKCRELPGEGPDYCEIDDDCTSAASVCGDTADIAFYVNMIVCGEQCGCSPGAETATTTINMPAAGYYTVTSNISYSGNCQLNESAYMNIEGVGGPVVWDEPYNPALPGPPDCPPIDRIVNFGTFRFKENENTITLNTAALCSPPSNEMNSVHVGWICLKRVTHTECECIGDGCLCKEVDGPGDNECGINADCGSKCNTWIPLPSTVLNYTDPWYGLSGYECTADPDFPEGRRCWINDHNFINLEIGPITREYETRIRFKGNFTMGQTREDLWIRINGKEATWNELTDGGGDLGGFNEFVIPGRFTLKPGMNLVEITHPLYRAEMADGLDDDYDGGSINFGYIMYECP